MAGRMARFTWAETREYWERHAELRAPVNLDEDPDALANVCHPGQPAWLNRYHAGLQRRVYRDLLSHVPPPAKSARALDVGCGGGRWCRLLADEGYRTVGIDLQDSLVAASRRRYPDIEFHTASVQEFSSKAPFDLISTVTVVQHIPLEEQVAVVRRLRALMRTGGHVIALENVRDQAPHVFARSIGEWRELFHDAGFEPLEERPYDYSPCSRSLRRLIDAAAARRAPSANPTPATLNTRAGSGVAAKGAWQRSAHRAALRACIRLDAALEPTWIRLSPPVPTVHCGFAFRAV
jgi:2-polyprenyl-3-methyl-5-hydroxy-6-metoxy-1,4-benzoquinol methylase